MAHSKEIVDRQMADRDGHFDDRDHVQDRADQEREQGGLEEPGLLAEQHGQGVQQAYAVEGGGQTQPKYGHFVH